MDLLRLLRNAAREMEAEETRRRFSVSSEDSNRSCCIDLTGYPENLVLINADHVASNDNHIGEPLKEPCDCEHRVGSESHLRCDYVGVHGEDLNLAVVYIEVKTGTSSQQSDVEHGFRQILCSKFVFESILDDCIGGSTLIDSVGVVISPAFTLSQKVRDRSSEWSIRNGIRLIKVRSGEDLWTKCMAS